MIRPGFRRYSVKLVHVFSHRFYASLQNYFEGVVLSY